MRYFRIVAIVAALGGLGLSGCGSDDEPATTTTAQADAKPANIAYVTFAYEDYVHAEETGIKRAVTPGGGTVKVFNAAFDPGKQFKDCQDAITSGRYNAIVLEPVESQASLACVKAAKTAGIPVVALTIPPGDANQLQPPDGVAGQVVITRDAQAKVQAEAAKLACEGLDPCKAIAEVAFPGDPATGGVVKAIKKAVPNVEIVQEISTGYDPNQLTKALPDALTAHPDVNAFFSISDGQALAALSVFKSAGLLDKIKVVGSGGTFLGAEAVKDGRITATTGSWPEQNGFSVGEMAIKAVNGQAIDPVAVDALGVDGPAVITKDTVGDFKPEWGPKQ